ncbi:protein rep [Staphylococcus epidermidis]|nr:protein rep [Staphylococcus epidermidis]MCG1995295.1 protein rep [Staphylococcus epidermidis]
MHLICDVKTFLNTISLMNNLNDLATIKEISKYFVKSPNFLTDDEKNQEIVNDLEKGLYRKRMLSYGRLLKQKHKILNLDDAEDGNLINTSNEGKTINEEEKAHSITAIWNFEKQNYYLKDLKL